MKELINLTEMANNNIESLYAAQALITKNSFCMEGQDGKKSTSQDSKASRSQEDKNSRVQELKKSREQEVKRARGQDVKKTRSQENKNSSRDDVKTSAGQEVKKSRVVDSGGVRRRPTNIMIREDYHRAIRLLAIDKNVQPWRLIDEALRRYLESENNQKTNSKNSQ